MKKVRYRLFDRIMSIAFLIWYMFVFIMVYKPASIFEILFSSIFIIIYIIGFAFVVTLITHFFYWQIDFDNEQFIFRTIFKKSITIKYNDIAKIDIKYMNTRNGICDKLTFHLKNTNIQPYILLPENADNYNEFFDLLMLITERNKS